MAEARRKPNPRPVLAILMGVAFFGGSCSMQKVMGPTRPSDSDVVRSLGFGEGQPPPVLAEAAKALVAAQTRAAERFHGAQSVFGVLLVAAYSFAFVFGLRAWHHAPNAAGPLSKIALGVLPLRAAVAAIDVSVAQVLTGPTRQFARALAEAQPTKLPPEQAQAVAQAMDALAPWFTIGFEVLSAVLVCALFQYAWRYFQRPEVIDYFERRTPSEG